MKQVSIFASLCLLRALLRALSLSFFLSFRKVSDIFFNILSSITPHKELLKMPVKQDQPAVLKRSQAEASSKSPQIKILLSQLLMHCPRATKNLPCDKCELETEIDQPHPRLKCHCGHSVTLPKSRRQNAETHWKLGMCLHFKNND